MASPFPCCHVYHGCHVKENSEKSNANRTLMHKLENKSIKKSQYLTTAYSTCHTGGMGVLFEYIF